MPRITVFKDAEAFGSFASLTDANKWVGRTLRENRAAVDLVANGTTKRNNKIEAYFSEPTGYEAFRSDPEASAYMQTAYGVRVVIVRDKEHIRGYRVLTAFPINNRGRQR